MKVKRENRYILYCVLSLCIMCFGIGISTYRVEAGDSVTEYSASQIWAISHSYTSIRVRWKQNKDADGYIIYRAGESVKRYSKVKELKGSDKTQWINRGLKREHVYKYKVSSYKVTDGRKQIIATTDRLFCKI